MVHNPYLGLAAKCGLLWVGLFLVVVAAALNAAHRAARRFDELADGGQRALAQAVLVAGTSLLDD